MRLDGGLAADRCNGRDVCQAVNKEPTVDAAVALQRSAELKSVLVWSINGERPFADTGASRR